MSKLNNIDDAIKNSFENFEVPFDASAWTALENKMDQVSANDLTSFDKKIKQSVTEHEVAYNPAAWTAVESQLVSSYSYTKWLVAAGLIGLVSLGIYFLSDDSSKEQANQTESSSDKVADHHSSNLKDKEDFKEENEVTSQEVESIPSNTTIEENSVTTVENTTSSPELKEKEENSLSHLNHPFEKEENKLLNNDNSSHNLVAKQWSIAQPSFTGKTEMCEGEEVKLISSIPSEKVSVQWILDGIPVSNSHEINLKNLTAGSHELELVHTAKADYLAGCTKTVQKKNIQLEVKENIPVDFKFEQTGDAFYPETKFNVLSVEKNVKYTWIMNGQTFTGEEIIHLFNDKGTYPVQLMAENEEGCKALESKNIEIGTDYNLLAPIAFTPNFDGLNDVFIPEALKYLNLPFTLNIYDRQQGIVFQSTRANIPWDGKNMNTGEFGSQGAYLWVVELTNKKGEIEQYSGTITILK